MKDKETSEADCCRASEPGVVEARKTWVCLKCGVEVDVGCSCHSCGSTRLDNEEHSGKA